MSNVFKARQGKIASFDPVPVQETLITHLLNQSRNFYQIETKVLKDNLLKNLQAASKMASERRNEKADPKKKDEEEYEYYEEDDILDEEERKLIQDENQERDADFKKAIDKLK